MKRKVIFTVLLLSSILGYSQQIIPQTLVYQDSVPYFYAWNDSIIQTRQDKFKRTMYININDRTTDSIKTSYGVFGQNLSSNDKTRKDIIYYGGDYYRLSVETGKIDTILWENKNEKYYVAIGNLLIGRTNKIDTTIGNYVISYDMFSGEKKILCNIEDDDCSIWGIDASITGLLFIDLGNASESTTSYYSYNIGTNSLIKKDYSDYIKDLYENSDLYHDDISGGYLIMGEFWVDTLFNIVQPTLSRLSNTNRGFKLKESDNYYYLNSEIDEPLRKSGSNKVWLPCRFTLPFDFCLYKIYNNQLLTKDEIAKFDEWELHKLKNMVFAKHGYKFNSHYLQAFYNLFAFYSGKYLDVNHLLTPEDKNNLALIGQESKKK